MIGQAKSVAAQMRRSSFFNMKHELAIYDGMIVYNDRIVIPKVLIPEMLDRLHTSHQGKVRCKNAARKVMYWRGMTNDIDDMVDKCEACLMEKIVPPKQPMIPMMHQTVHFKNLEPIYFRWMVTSTN